MTITRNTWNYLLKNPGQYTEYRLMTILGIHEDFMETADTQYVSSVFDRLQELMECVSVNPFTGLARTTGGTTDLVDWTRAETPGYDFSGTTYKTVINIFAYRAYADMAELSAAIGRNAEAVTYATEANSLRSTINARLFSTTAREFLDGLDSVGTPVPHSSRQNDYLALALGVINDPEEEDSLASSIAKEGRQEVGSIYMAYFFYHGLARSGYGDVAIQILLRSDNDDIRTYAHVLETLGATMTPEAWSESSKMNLSYSHVWGTGGGSGLFDALFGITPTSPAFANFDMTVNLGPLSFAAASIPTLRGTIVVNTRRGDDGTLKVVTRVPSGTTSAVRIPMTASTSELTLDGEALPTDTKVSTLYTGTHTLVLRSPITLTVTLEDGDISVPTLNGEANTWVTNDSGLFSLSLDGHDGSSYLVSVKSGSGAWSEFRRGAAQADGSGPITALRLKTATSEIPGRVLAYRVFTADDGWKGWAREGETTGVKGAGDSIIGIQVELQQR